MPDARTVELTPNQQQRLSDETQNNNGNDRSPPSTGVGAQEKFIPITALLEMVAKMLGVLVCGWVVLVLVQGGMVNTVETKDRGFITLLFFLVCFRCWRYYCPQAPGSLTDATTQSLPSDYSSIQNNIRQWALPICYIHRLYYYFRLVSAMTSVVLSVMRLASQDFGKKEVANKESQDFDLKVFYGLTLAEALVFLFALTLSFPILGNSVRPADGHADGPGVSPGDDLENGPGGEPGDGSGDGPVNRPVYCYYYRPVNQSNDFNSEGPADSLPDFNSEGPADSIPDLRQRRGKIPQVRQSIECNALAQEEKTEDKSAEDGRQECEVM